MIRVSIQRAHLFVHFLYFLVLLIAVSSILRSLTAVMSCFERCTSLAHDTFRLFWFAWTLITFLHWPSYWFQKPKLKNYFTFERIMVHDTFTSLTFKQMKFMFTFITCKSHEVDSHMLSRVHYKHSHTCIIRYKPISNILRYLSDIKKFSASIHWMLSLQDLDDNKSLVTLC